MNDNILCTIYSCHHYHTDIDFNICDSGDINTDSLKRMAADLLDRSVLRLDELVADHKTKIAELDTAMAGAAGQGLALLNGGGEGGDITINVCM